MRHGSFERMDEPLESIGFLVFLTAAVTLVAGGDLSTEVLVDSSATAASTTSCDASSMTMARGGAEWYMCCSGLLAGGDALPSDETADARFLERLADRSLLDSRADAISVACDGRPTR
jgi:hypothetical protein